MKKRSFHYKKILGISLALALFLGGIGIVQNILDERTQNFEDETVVKVDENQTKENKTEEKKVETLKSPVKDGIGIVRYYYDKDDDATKQEQSLILFEDVYRPNQGIDYANKNENLMCWQLSVVLLQRKQMILYLAGLSLLPIVIIFYNL